MRLIEELKLLGAFDKAELSPSAKKHKKEYDTKYESTPARKKYRRDLERERRKRGVDGKGGKDMSHTARGTIVPEDMHANRARHFKSKGTLKKIYAPDDRPRKKPGEDDDTPPPATRREDYAGEWSDLLENRDHPIYNTPISYDEKGNPIPPKYKPHDLDIGRDCRFECGGGQVHRHDGAIGCTNSWCAANTPEAMMESSEGRPQGEPQHVVTRKVGDVFATRPTVTRVDPNPPEDSVEAAVARMTNRRNPPKQDPYHHVSFVNDEIFQTNDFQGNPPSNYRNMRHPDIRTGEPMDIALDVIEKNLNRWFKEKWVDVSRKNKDGSHPPCGRSKASKSKRGYPKCRPSVKVSSKTPKTSGSMSEGQKRAATKRKRSKRQGVGGKPTIVKARRIPRKKGQPANSKKHSDLYTDENPKGTIHGLGFKNTAKAKQSVVKIKNSSRTHAHKTQAAIAMEQRAREMGKKKEAGVYRNFIEEQKKKTEEMKKAFPAKYAGNCAECGTYFRPGEYINRNKFGEYVCSRSPGCGMVYVR